ncbi:MAG: hypothetical protein JXA66_03815 [Oligoflexia bacterium]|nr:hypothetical protein [Oligoflexia bacterium]
MKTKHMAMRVRGQLLTHCGINLKNSRGETYFFDWERVTCPDCLRFKNSLRSNAKRMSEKDYDILCIRESKEQEQKKETFKRNAEKFSGNGIAKYKIF